jgi:hypothetical protein
MNTIESIGLQLLPFGLFAAGGYLFWHGLTAWIKGTRQTGDSGGRLLGMVKGFRVGIIGLAVVGIAIWLLTDATWVLVVSLAVGGEELLESSFIISTLRSDPRLKEPAS